MALSRVRYEQTVAGNRSFAVPFAYLRKEHVEVKADGVTIAFTWVDNQNILTNVAPTVGAVVLVKRVTPTDVQVDFTDGSTLTEKELDLAYLQNLYLAQERIDDAEDTMKIGDNGHWDARSRRITNMANPVGDNDAVTLGHLNTRLQAIADLVTQIEGYLSDAEGLAQDAADSAAIASAQVALAAAQAAIAQGYAEDAADQVALAEAQVAIAAGHAADAASYVSDAAAQVAIAAGHAADAQAAQAAAELAAGGAEDVLQEIEDKLVSGELGSYPGVMDEDPINQNIRKAYAAITSTEDFDPPFNTLGNTDLTSGLGKGILTPGLGAYAGKMTMTAWSASPAKLRFDTASERFQYQLHDSTVWVNLEENDKGQPILTLDNGEVLVVGSLPSITFVYPSSFGSEVDISGYTRSGMYGILTTIPVDPGNGKQSQQDFDNAYKLIVLGDRTGGYETNWDCLQEVTLEYQSTSNPNERMMRKFTRHVSNFQGSFWGGNWTMVGGDSGTPIVYDGTFERLIGTGSSSTNGYMRLLQRNSSRYFQITMNGTTSTDKSITMGTENIVGVIKIDEGNGTLSLNNDNANNHSKLMMPLTNATGPVVLHRHALGVDSIGINSYFKIGMGSHNPTPNPGQNYFGIQNYGAWTVHVGSSTTGTSHKTLNFNRSGEGRYAGYASGTGVGYSTLLGFTTSTANSTYSYLFVKNGTGLPENYIGVGGTLDSGAPQVRANAYSYDFRRSTDAVNPYGSVAFHVGNSVRSSDDAAYSLIQGTGINIFGDLTNNYAGVRISPRSTSPETGVGVISSTGAGSPGEAEGVAPLRFSQNVATGETKVWLASDTTIGTESQNSVVINDAEKTVISVTRMSHNRKMITIRQRSATPDANGVITLTLPESYKKMLHIGYQRDQDATGVSVSYIPDSYNMDSAVSRSTVSVGFVKATPSTFTPATTALDCAGTLVFIVEE